MINKLKRINRGLFELSLGILFLGALCLIVGVFFVKEFVAQNRIVILLKEVKVKAQAQSCPSDKFNFHFLFPCSPVRMRPHVHRVFHCYQSSLCF